MLPWVPRGTAGGLGMGGEGNLRRVKVTSWCLVGAIRAWLLSSFKRHIASLAGMGSKKKDKGIFELLSHLGAFCTEKPKAGLTMDKVFVSTSACDKNVFLAR